jgi:hypothetical protein
MPDTPGSFELQSQSGLHVHNPSRDQLAQAIASLAAPANQYLYVQPHIDSDWYVLISLPDPATADPYEGTYDVQFCDDDGQAQTQHCHNPGHIAALVLPWIISRLNQQQ